MTRFGDQLVMFDVPNEPSNDTAPFAPHSDTSFVAAQAQTKRGRATARQRVLDALHRAGARGMTRRELEIGLRMNGSTVRPRVLELMRDRYVMTTSEVRDGCSVIVHTLTEARDDESR